MAKVVVKRGTIIVCIHNFLTEIEARAFILGMRILEESIFDYVDSVKLDGKEVKWI